MADPILVTGGAGFIGSHLCEALINAGEAVLCLDNFCDFYPPERKRRNIANLLSHPEFTLLEADIRDDAILRDIFSSRGIDAVIHLAAMAGVQPSIQAPGLYTDVNVRGTLNLLNACAEAGVRRFIFASSSSVYGNSSPVPFTESDPANAPVSPYAATKKAGEALCHTWHVLHGISMLCLRFFTVYGPRQRPDLAIHKFLRLMANGQPVPIYGDGSSSRDYTYYSDTVEGILAALDYVRAHQCFDVINLGNDRAVTLLQMVEALESVSRIIAIRSEYPFRDGDMLHTRADISRARALLGYTPRVDFLDGLKAFWEWFQSTL